ncbi:MAG: hypothetical protein DBO99_03070 [gamma proteobacterium symbiont of Ctena orbiculata]|nr:MAG: hypothetical protein DBO99_03070 [gamma proteobacterium symbiont of Ctena orbiculata]
MSPEQKSRIEAFVGVFFDGKELERLICGSTSLTDKEVSELITTIDQYQEAQRELSIITPEIISGPPISVQELAEYFGDQERHLFVSKEEQEHTFDAALDSLLEELVDNSEVPSAVQILAVSNELSVTESIKKMDDLFYNAKRERIDSVLPRGANISTEVREEKIHEIKEFYDALKRNLVHSIEKFPYLWGQGQQAIAHLEPIYELWQLFISWDGRSGLSGLSQKLRQCSAYKALHRYAHPFLALSTLSDLLEQDTLDAEAVDQTLWTLVHGKGKPGAKTISDRLSFPRQRLYSRLAGYLEDIIAAEGNKLTVKERSRLYCAVEVLVSEIPANIGNIQLRTQDLCWRALLLSKANEDRRAAELAVKAINEASGVELPINNPFLWWSRLGDAHFIVAYSFSDPNHPEWSRGMECYNEALRYAFDENKPMVYLRQASANADRVEFYESKISEVEIEFFLEFANGGIDLANKAIKSEGRSETGIFTKARIEAALARLGRKIGLKDADTLEAKFFDSIKELQYHQPSHSGALRIAFNYLTNKGDLVGALDWLDTQIASLRDNAKDSYIRLANYLEYRAAEHAIDFGLEDEARERLIKIVRVTQPNNVEAWKLLNQLGFSIDEEHVAQNHYTQARQKIPGSVERKERAERAILTNQPLVDRDPGMNDVVPWTRHARLKLFLDDFTAAIKILEGLQSKFPSDPYVQFHIGEAYYRQGTQSPDTRAGADSSDNYDRAVNAFKRAWQIYNRVDTAHQLSACWSRKGDVDKERYWLEKAEEIDPSDGWTKLSLGWSAYKGGAMKKAVSYWVDALKYLCTERELAERQQALAYLAARSVVRYGQTCQVEELDLEQLSGNAIRLIASAASGTGWRYPRVIESLGRFLHEIPVHGLRRIPHAVRAHLIFLQLSGEEEFARQWHNQWYENFRAFKDSSLLVEYLSGGKSVFRRAALWSIEQNVARNLFEESSRYDSKVDWERWGAFVQVASSWEIQKDYYRKVYSAFPVGEVGSEELYLVLQVINQRLFRTAMDELGLDKTPSNISQVTAILSRIPIEPEILPATEIDQSAPEWILVHTDELSSRFLLNSASELIEQSSVNELRISWNLVGDRLCCSLNQRNGFTTVDFDSFRAFASRNANQIIESPEGGVDICIQAWA